MKRKFQSVTRVPVLPRRSRDAHKGDFGRVLIVGGSRGMVGAVALAANSALRGGCGLATFAAPESVQLAVATLCPCATSIALSCNRAGALSEPAVQETLDAAAGCDVIAVGPGFAIAPVQTAIVMALLAQDKPVVIDADGLNNLAATHNWPALRRCPLVLTPHPGEFSRLTGKSVEKIQADRKVCAVAAAVEWTGKKAGSAELALVLKGAGTIVTDSRRVYVNASGNPGMATGGSGDVLTGLTAAMLAQGLSPFDAAVLAVHIHGRAGDLAVRDLGEASLIASDLVDYLPRALR
jgi:NAD(P)H-hydrate epimerase